MAFRIIGLLGVAWALVMRYFSMSADRGRIVNVSMANRLCSSQTNLDDSVPWLRLFAQPAFWAMVLTHACQNNCFFVLLSWLPTYFHENFPQEKGWVVNMIPWLALPPCTLLGKYMTDFLIRREWSMTNVRKSIQSICFVSQNMALLIMSRTNHLLVTLVCMTVVIGEFLMRFSCVILLI